MKLIIDQFVIIWHTLQDNSHQPHRKQINLSDQWLFYNHLSNPLVSICSFIFHSISSNCPLSLLFKYLLFSVFKIQLAIIALLKRCLSFLLFLFFFQRQRQFRLRALSYFIWANHNIILIKFELRLRSILAVYINGKIY